MNNDTKKGVFFGILITIAAILVFNTAQIGYRTLIKKEINYETKEKTIYNLMKDNYVDDIDENEIYEGLYTGMVALATDKYSRYISAEDFESYKISTSGNYAGIGAKTSIDPDDYSIYIVSTYENSPAAKAGLKAGDKILKVDGTVVNYDNYSDAIDKIRGEEGTEITLTIKRGTETFDAKVTRGHVDVPTVGGTVLDNNIGYIKIEGFESVTYDQYKEVYEDLRDQGITSLIIDLRNNPGGLLDIVSEIADDIIPEGIITYTEDKNGKKEYIRSSQGELDIPLAVLVNENSASASELLTAAIKDTGKGIIIGKNTYGKGVVQTTLPLNDGSAVKLTTSKYYTPNGVCIDGKGIAPDIEVDNPTDYEYTTLSSNKVTCDTQNDKQLITAINELTK
ncbi:MAG: S41 family peptidase [Clostridia bacterium]|nr:S41 family peptidase [Clostridia bacterium]